MKKLRWQIVIILLTGLVVGVLLLNQQQQQQQQQTPPALQATVVPSSGGIYTEALVGSFQRFNPLLAMTNSPDHDIDRLIFSSLIRFDASGNPQPDLAESWGYSKDGTLYNFSLRNNLFWQDGQPITADDVTFTVDMIRNSTSVVPDDLRAFWKDVEIKRLSDTELQFRLPEAFAPFLDYLTFGVLPKHLLGQMTFDQMVNDSFNLKPVGSGPYRFDHFLMDQDKIAGVVLTVFDNYYAQKPFIQQIVFRYYADSKAALAAYQAGEVQGIGQVTADILPAALAEPSLALYTARQPRLMMVYFNLNSDDVPFFKDANFRRALLTGLNRQGMIDHLLAGQAVVADGPILPGTWAYYDGIEHLGYDPAQAMVMLRAAGYDLNKDGSGLINVKDTTPVKFQLVYPDASGYQAIAESIKSDWAALGIEVDLLEKPYDKLISENLDPRTYQAALVEINMSQTPDPDPYPFWDQAMTGTGGQNYAQWSNVTASEYLESARVTFDQAERGRLYRNFQVIFTKEMPALPLYFPVYTYGIDQQIKGVQIGPLFDQSDRFAGIFDWYLPAKKNTVNTISPTAIATLAPTK